MPAAARAGPPCRRECLERAVVCIVVMRADDSRIRRLIEARGVVIEGDGGLRVEPPGRLAYATIAER